MEIKSFEIFNEKKMGKEDKAKEAFRKKLRKKRDKFIDPELQALKGRRKSKKPIDRGAPKKVNLNKTIKALKEHLETDIDVIKFKDFK